MGRNSKCGSRLIFVCEKCFAEIEDIDHSHKKCKRCEAEATEKKEKAKDTVKNVAGSKGVKEAVKVIPKAIRK